MVVLRRTGDLVTKRKIVEGEVSREKQQVSRLQNQCKMDGLMDIFSRKINANMRDGKSYLQGKQGGADDLRKRRNALLTSW